MADGASDQVEKSEQEEQRSIQYELDKEYYYYLKETGTCTTSVQPSSKLIFL